MTVEKFFNPVQVKETHFRARTEQDSPTSTFTSVL